MRDILLKRNELRKKSSILRTIKFDEDFDKNNFNKVKEEQDKMYNHWKFYDRFIKAREEVKNEAKSNDMGKTK